MGASLTALRALLLAVLVFPIGLATHEFMHLVVWSALGYPAVLVVTRWRLGLAGADIFGLHAAPAVTTPPLEAQVLSNLLGPLLAAALLLGIWAQVPAAQLTAPLRAALAGNVLVLVFFALLEVAYPLLEEVGGISAGVLLWPELNYGGSLLILVLLAAWAALRAGRAHRRGTGGQPLEPSGEPAPGPPAGRQPAR